MILDHLIIQLLLTLYIEISNSILGYYEEAAKIKGSKRAQKLFKAAVNISRGFAHNDPETMEFAKAFKKLDDLKTKACNEQNLSIALVSLAAVPEGEKYNKKRKIRKKI